NRLITLLEEQRDYVSALDFAWRLLQVDPLEEETYVCLMRLHALNNDRASALRAYHQCVTMLQRELDLEPGLKVSAAYKQLLHLDTQELSPAVWTSPVSGSARLIGRHPEWEQLRAAWQRALGGCALVALITGEAGIGKTRLAEELLGWAGQQGIATARTRTYAAEGRLSYTSIAEWLRSSAISPALDQLDRVWLREIARLLPELVTRYRDLSHPGSLTEHWQRQRFFEALVRGVLAVNSPLVLQIDDLQWCDQETLEWLHFLVRFAPNAKLLILATARVEEMHTNAALTVLLRSLRSMGQLIELPLAPLDAAEISKLATSIGGREPDIAGALHLFRETEGNPLFVVEIMRAQLGSAVRTAERGRHAPLAGPQHLNASPALPPKVYAVIAGRLTQLSPPAYELAGVAATIGRAFTVAVLADAYGKDEDSFVNALDELWQRRIIREHDANTYDFSHDKLREVAYIELSPIQRRKLHRRVAQALEHIYASDLDPLSAQLAAHYEQAGFIPEALRAYARAVVVTQRVFAHEEAIHLLQRALALLQTLASSYNRDPQELALHTALGASFVALKGYGATEAMEAYYRARSLCEQLGQPPSPPILRALVLISIGKTRFVEAQAIAEQLLHYADQQQDQMLIVEGHYALGVALFYHGAFERSRRHLEQAINLYDPAQGQLHIAMYAQDSRVVCLNRLALDLWCMGYPDQAAAKRQEALLFAEQLAHPFSLGYCLGWDALLQSVCRDNQAALVQADATVALGREYQLGQWLPMGIALRGWALAGRDAQTGALEQGRSELQQGIDAFYATGFEALHPYFLALLADLQLKSADIDRCMHTLREALALTHTSGEWWCASELYRRQGEVLVLRGEDVAAEAALQQAIDTAHSQSAYAFELRAATSLARMRLQQGRLLEAQQVLSPIYGWFSEGFDTPDMLEARAILQKDH
ncbi:MAG: AAA family ATPase, partial [Chloroflexota bacterium]|nr:AAA family ATPase [Chloroflexota bacterium]